MKIDAIIYTSNTGYTKRYADMLSSITGLPIYDLKDKSLKKGSKVIYMGWLMAGLLKGYKKAKRRYDLQAVCAVSLGTPGEAIQAMNMIKVPVYWLQGGMDHSKLKGIYKTMINTLIKVLSKRKENNKDEQAMLELIKAGGDFVNEKNLAPVVRFIKKQNK